MYKTLFKEKSIFRLFIFSYFFLLVSFFFPLFIVFFLIVCMFSVKGRDVLLCGWN
uniref:Uncharacterized protein n=1 Tax=Anguilla anguilla TaxID=7936 RepID=A0A0E9V349_ANGAN